MVFMALQAFVRQPINQAQDPNVHHGKMQPEISGYSGELVTVPMASGVL